MFRFLLLLSIACSPSREWAVRQPSANIWVTLAKAMGSDQMCMSTDAVHNPLSSSLVGVPAQVADYPRPLVELWEATHQLQAKFFQYEWTDKLIRIPLPIRNPLALWGKWVMDLAPMDREPEEFQLLGSLKAPFCVHFGFEHRDGRVPKVYQGLRQGNENYIANNWCDQIAHLESPSSPHLAYPHPIRLPKGLFLVCGERAWTGIPSLLVGGPCTFGHLTLASPNMTHLPVWSNNSVPKSKLDTDCSTEIYHWSRGKRIAVSAFLPWVAAAKALGELGNLECWVAKQAQLTSEDIADLLQDEEVTRKATLQNRAAIDFLLLAHGHGCQQFEGLCCFNLSSQSRSIHQRLQDMDSLLANMTFESNRWFEDTIFGVKRAVNSTLTTVGSWAHKALDGLGLPGWGVSLLKDCIIIFVATLLIAAALAIFKRSLVHQFSSLFSKNRGGVEGRQPSAAQCELPLTEVNVAEAEATLDAISWGSEEAEGAKL